MRTFIALELPVSLVRTLDQLIRRLSQVQPYGIAWVKAEKLHLTLRFLGETSEEQAACLKDKLGTIRMEGFTLESRTIGLFPESSPARVIWVGIRPDYRLENLVSLIEIACRDCGFLPETRNFKPHMTLGRVKTLLESRISHEIRECCYQEFGTFHVTGFTLFNSRLTPEGAVYEPIQYFRLGE